jgi:hypothetical protein
MAGGGWGTPHPGNIPEVGETFVQGKTQETARALLDAADALGLDRAAVVRTVNKGFIVPNEVWDQAEETRLAAEGREV